MRRHLVEGADAFVAERPAQLLDLVGLAVERAAHHQEHALGAVGLHQFRDGLRRRLAVVDLLHLGENDASGCQHYVLPESDILLSWRRKGKTWHSMTGTRAGAIGRAEKYFDDGGFLAELQRRVAIPTTSQEQDSMPALQEYVSGEMTSSLQKLGYDCTVLPNPRTEYGPFLIARRIEDPAKPTVLTYGHGDVIRGQDEQWRQGLSPWKIVIEGDRMYGRGTADNKGQHTINIAALACVLEERGSLGFNSTILIETGEETGSPGLADFCKANKAALKADALIGSDGPRLDHRRPTIFGGTRGTLNFNLKLTMREGGHHSGNWGGLLSNPGIILAHALATITDARGQIKVPEWRPKTLTNSVRAALADAHVDAGEGAPTIDPKWGEK